MRWILIVLLALMPAGTALANAWLAPGESLTASHVEAIVEAGLPPAGGERRYEIEVASPRLPLPNTASVPAFMQLLSLDHDERQERFMAQIEVRLESGESSVIRLHGRLRTLQRVAVPRESISRGTRIVPDMLESSWISARRLKASTILDEDALVGLEAARRLAAGRAIDEGDVREPLLVRRGQPVEVVFRRGPLLLSTTARALEDGARGQMVKVANIDSGRELHALVTGPGRADISLAGRRR